MMAALAMKLNTFPEVGDEVAIHLCPGLMNPLLGLVIEVNGIHLTIELNGNPGVFLVVPRSTCTWC